MELFIRIKDGQPFEHPIFGDNFREAFPAIDVNDLPPEFARFEQAPQPILGPYEKNQRFRYEIQEDGICRQIWECDQLTEEERQEKITQTLIFHNLNDGPKSWIFNEEKCEFDPPIPHPNDGQPYFWDEKAYQQDNSTGWVLSVINT